MLWILSLCYGYCPYLLDFLYNSYCMYIERIFSTHGLFICVLKVYVSRRFCKVRDKDYVLYTTYIPRVRDTVINILINIVIGMAGTDT